MFEVKSPWNNWKIVNEIGKGTCGVVYEIQRDSFGMLERAAMKVIPLFYDYRTGDSLYKDDEYSIEEIRAIKEDSVNDIVKEYQMSMKLRDCVNIVVCDDIYIDQDYDKALCNIYIRMELLTPLNNVLANRLFIDEDVIKLGKDVCRALIACENNNITHRDIKPENIFISKYGDYKLGDFGIAKVMSHTTYATSIGTERFVAPEVAKCEKYSRQADIYSLGLSLYWVLNRKMPFLSTQKRISGRYTMQPPRNGSDELKRVVMKACAYELSDRYHSASEMLAELEEIKTDGNI